MCVRRRGRTLCGDEGCAAGPCGDEGRLGVRLRARGRSRPLKGEGWGRGTIARTQGARQENGGQHRRLTPRVKTASHLLEKDLEGTAQHDVERVALLALLDDRLALTHVPHLHSRAELIKLLLGDGAEDGVGVKSALQAAPPLQLRRGGRR